MDALTPLFANTGLSGAVLAALFTLVYILLRDKRIENDKWMELQKETNEVLRELSGLIRKFEGMSRH